jgi:hypothetical protein
VPKISIANFTSGIQASPGFSEQRRYVSAADMRNLLVDSDGRLVTRSGRSNIHSSAETSPILQMISAVYQNESTGATYTHLFIQTSTMLKYWNGSAFNNVSIGDPLTTGGSAISWAQPYNYCVAGNRLFLAVGSQSPPLWVDLKNDPASSPPTVYHWGLVNNSYYTPNTAMPEIVPSGQTSGGNLLQGGFYGYAFTYYNSTYGIESYPSKVIADSDNDGNRKGIAQITGTGSQGQVIISGMTTSTDPQIDKKRIYRTTKQDDVDSAAGAQLYFVYEIDNAVTSWTDNGDIVDDVLITQNGLASSNTSGPPTTLKHITHYAGRIWGALQSSSTIIYSEIGGDTAPIYDSFPTASADFPHLFYVQAGDGDKVTSLEPSPSGQELQVFKEHSMTLIRGTGLVSGLQPITIVSGGTYADIDASFINRSAGAVDNRSVATGAGRTFVLANDRQIWEVASGQMKVFSLPIQPFLDQIQESRLDEVVAWVHQNKYYIAFPRSAIATTNNMIAVYDLAKQYWTLFDSYSSSSNFDRITAAASVPHQDKQYVAVSQDGTNYYVSEYLKSSDTTDASVEISPKYTSNQIKLPAESSINAVYVYPKGTGSAVSVSILSPIDGTLASGSFTPKRSNRFRRGLFARGEDFRVQLTGTGLDQVERIEIEYQTR